MPLSLHINPPHRNHGEKAQCPNFEKSNVDQGPHAQFGENDQGKSDKQSLSQPNLETNYTNSYDALHFALDELIARNR
jgi:hypothetical protein